MRSPPSSTTGPPAVSRSSARPLSRRDAYRQATVEEIKQRARRQLAEHGAGGLSLRAIAREMRMASSAIYRYFASHDELVSALCVDAYHALADALATACDAQPLGDHARRWWAICHAYRRWALDDRPGFALLFGTPLPGYRAPEPVTGPAASRFAAIPLGVFAAAVQAGTADPNSTPVPQTLELGELLHDLLDRNAAAGVTDATGPDYPPQLAAIALTAWAAVLGYLVAEIFGSLPRLVTDTDQLFRAHVRTVMLGMGFDPTLVNAVEPEQG